MNFINSKLVETMPQLSYLTKTEEKTHKDPELEAFLKLPCDIQAKILKYWHDQQEEKDVEANNKELDKKDKQLSQKSKYREIQPNSRFDQMRERLRKKLLQKHNLL